MTHPNPTRYQFSLRWLFIAITLAAIAFGVIAIWTNWIESLFAIVVFWLLPAPLLIFAIFDRGYRQAFAIGALVPFGASMLADSIGRIFFGYGELFGSLMHLALGAVAGLLAVWARRCVR